MEEREEAEEKEEEEEEAGAGEGVQCLFLQQIGATFCLDDIFWFGF